MEKHIETVQIANTQIQFGMSSGFTPDNPYCQTLMYWFKLNGIVFDSQFELEPHMSKEDILKKVTSETLNQMLARAAYPSIRNSHAVKSI